MFVLPSYCLSFFIRILFNWDFHCVHILISKCFKNEREGGKKINSIHLCAVGFCSCVQPIWSRSVFIVNLNQSDEQTNCEGVIISQDTTKTTGRMYKIVINK